MTGYESEKSSLSKWCCLGSQWQNDTAINLNKITDFSEFENNIWNNLNIQLSKVPNKMSILDILMLKWDTFEVYINICFALSWTTSLSVNVHWVNPPVRCWNKSEHWYFKSRRCLHPPKSLYIPSVWMNARLYSDAPARSTLPWL